MRLFHHSYYYQILNTYIMATIKSLKISKVNSIKIEIKIQKNINL